MGSDPKIVGSDHLALGLQGFTNASIGVGSLHRQRQDLDQACELLQVSKRSRSGRALLGAIEELTVGNDGKGSFPCLKLMKASHHLRRMASSDVDADVRIEQEAVFHQSSSRDCGGSFLAFS